MEVVVGLLLVVTIVARACGFGGNDRIDDQHVARIGSMLWKRGLIRETRLW